MTPPRGTMRWFGHPMIVLGLLAFLIADFLSIPRETRRSSTIRQLLPGRERLVVATPRSLMGGLYRTDAGLVWSWRWDESTAGRKPLFAGVLRRPAEYTGFYHLTRRRDALVILDDFEEPLTAEEMAALRTILIDAIDQDAEARRLYASERSLLAQAPTRGGREYVDITRLYEGYFRNALAAIVLGLLLACLFAGRSWLWQPALAPAQVRRRRRMRRGECLGCGYDLTGLPDTGDCPECGERRV